MPPLILITRPRDGADAFARELSAELGPDADICVSPLMEIEHMEGLPDLTPVRTLIFTSAHAVTGFAKSAPRRSFACYTVGDATAARARAEGFDPIPGPGTGQALAAQILRDGPETPCLYLRGSDVAFDMAEYLNASGIETLSATVYRQVSRPLSGDARLRIQNATTVIAPIFSPRSAELLLDAVPEQTRLWVAAISDAAANVLPSGLAAHIGVAQSPDKAAMVACVANLWRNANQLEGGSTAQ